MTADTAKQLGQFLKTTRIERGLSTHQLAERADVNQATIVRLEAGTIQAPHPDKLVRIAEALGISTADAFALAGYAAPSALPDLRPYLAARYESLHEEDLDKIEKYVNRLLRKRHAVASLRQLAGAHEAAPARE